MWKAMHIVSDADRRREEAIRADEGLDRPASAEDIGRRLAETRREARRAKSSFVYLLTRGSQTARYAEERVTRLRWLHRLVEDDEADIANGLRLLESAIKNGDRQRADRIRQEMADLYPWVELPKAL